MSTKIADLYAMSDAEVIAEHDSVAASTSVRTDYRMTELERRWREKSDRLNGRGSMGAARIEFSIALSASSRMTGSTCSPIGRIVTGREVIFHTVRYRVSIH